MQLHTKTQSLYLRMVNTANAFNINKQFNRVPLSHESILMAFRICSYVRGCKKH